MKNVQCTPEKSARNKEHTKNKGGKLFTYNAN